MSRIWDFALRRGRTAMIDDTGFSVSYDEIMELQEELDDAVRPGELTMMLAENSIGALLGYAAIINGGRPLLMVSAEREEDMLRKIMNTYRPAFIYTPKDRRRDFCHMKEIREIDNYLLLKTNYTENYPVHPELGQLITTSGSTGSVKFVRQSFDNIRINAGLLVNALEMDSEERTITALPFNYTYGLSIFAANLAVGGTMIVTKMGILDEEFWDIFECEHVTAFHGVPDTYAILQRNRIFDEDFPDLRILTQAGGKLSEDLHRSLAEYADRYGKLFVIMYGQSEATAAISCLPPDKALQKIGSVGTAFPGGGTAWVCGEGGSPAAGPGVSGELIYRGENVALGYASSGEDLIRGDDFKGELHTGDIGYMDEDGFLYVTGRKKRIIKIAGSRISLDEIDSLIMNDIHIPCVSVGEDDNLVIFVLGDENVIPVREYVRKKLKMLRTAFRVEAICAFPRNEGGKILYGELLEEAKQLTGDR